ncbi:uncharacterized protein LOC134078805 [Sardina pilchardus]|uniref:uncharacterized protein LOC134078805 n=1 Tax=Sardina pilchardus TaxID=27697 RepID=UPI002E0DF450
MNDEPPGVAAEGRPLAPAAAEAVAVPASATAPGPAAAAVDRPPAAATVVPTGQVPTAAARVAVTLAAALAVAASVPVLPAPLRLLAPLPPAPSAAVLAVPPTAAAAATGPFRATQPLLLDLSMPQQTVRVLPIPPPNAPSDNASPTRPPSAAGRRTSRRPSGACTAAAGQDSKDNKQCRQHLLLSLSLHTKLNRRGGRGLSRGQRHSQGQSPLPGPACHKCTSAENAACLCCC